MSTDTCRCGHPRTSHVGRRIDGECMVVDNHQGCPCSSFSTDTTRDTPISDTLTDMAQRCHTHLCTLWEAFTETARPGGGGFTCDEADALFDLYTMFGLHEMANTIMCWHAESDTDEGDRHMVTAYDGYYGDNPSAWAYKPADSDDDDSE